MTQPGSTTVGWREWVGLPDWGVDAIKAKIDTGARTSALHAFDLELFERDEVEWVRFAVQPWQRFDDDVAVVEAIRVDHRTITSSSASPKSTCPKVRSLSGRRS